MNSPGSTPIALALLAALSLAASGCEDPDNFLDGSLGSVYDLTFSEVEVTQFLQSDSLHIEYLRAQGTGEEKPLMVTVTHTPDGPGTFVHDSNATISMTASLASSARLPPMSSAEVVVETFTPGEIDSEVRGTIHAMFTGEGGGGDAFSLEGAFLSTLHVVP